MDARSRNSVRRAPAGVLRRRARVSVVIPARNEAESIPLLAAEIESVMDRTGLAWECLWVDDGSTDPTLAILRGLRERRPEHQFLSFDRNYGQSAALLAGFKAAAGEILVTMDADLQNDPRDIPRLLKALGEGGVGMVNAVRQKRRDSLVRRLSSRVANGFRNRVTGERMTDVGCSLRAFYADCVADIPCLRGVHRFIPSFARLRGYAIVEIPVGHRARRFGDTNYGIGNRLWVGILDTLGVRWLQARAVQPKVRVSSFTEGAVTAREEYEDAPPAAGVTEEPAAESPEESAHPPRGRHLAGLPSR